MKDGVNDSVIKDKEERKKKKCCVDFKSHKKTPDEGDDDIKEEFIEQLPFAESSFRCIHKCPLFPYKFRTFYSNNAHSQNYQCILPS